MIRLWMDLVVTGVSFPYTRRDDPAGAKFKVNISLLFPTHVGMIRNVTNNAVIPEAFPYTRRDDPSFSSCFYPLLHFSLHT